VTGGYDPRQYTRELQERYNELRDLQRQLGPNSPYARELDAIANNLQTLIRDNKLVGNPQAIEKLSQQIIDPFRGVELELSRALELLLAKENIRSAKEEDFPEDYAKYLEEYYKKLSSNSTKQ
jgi:hypothetical protein